MGTDGAGELARAHTVSVVVPVYQGERTLPALLAELAALTEEFSSPDGHRLRVAEVLLVNDNGPDGSAEVMRGLAVQYPFVRTVWLSRNFGQHAATLAGMASSGGDWIVTMDEDGQHDPAFIGPMLDVAMAERADVVYAEPTNPPPHGVARNFASRTSKRLLRASTSDVNATQFQSYRLVLGEISRSVAAYAGAGVYLDVALAWVARKVATCPVPSAMKEIDPPGTPCGRCRLTSGGWCSPAAPGPSGWSACWESYSPSAASCWRSTSSSASSSGT